MHKHILLSAFLLITNWLTAQTPISGIVNNYVAVSEIINCESKVTVNNTIGFAPNDFVIIMQMQGATIKENDNSEFGDIEDLGSAGLFEKAEILSISGNEITFKKLLVNQYDVAGNVQLIYLPKYDNATVESPLTGMAWDGSTGGVVAIEVENTLTLNANIIATGIGFRGGEKDIIPSDCSFITNANDYFYETGNWRGAPKGEGIAANIVNKENGRGAQANGGGGGNDHNAGGGGGGHISMGGQGGEQNAPSTFGCSGDYPGVGGKGISATQTRVFLGGGGGSGHADNVGAGSSGGNGGGIIIVIANTVVSGSNDLVANGLTSVLANGDGGGGGGAGGSVFLLAQNVMGAMGLEAIGGDGSDTTNPADRCFGPGGGGSGGRILFNPMAVPGDISLAGGIAGINSTNSTQCNGLSNGATDGQGGSLGTFTGIVEGNEELTATEILEQPNSATICTGNDYQLAAEVAGNNLVFQWQMDNGSGFMNLQNGANFSGVNTAILTILNANTALDGNQFQLIITNVCSGEVISEAATVDVEAGTTANFAFSNMGDGMFQFANLSSNFNSVFWDFGDMSTSMMANPAHTFEEGEYTVTLTAFGDCDTTQLTQVITVTTAPIADFSFIADGECVPSILQFSNESSENTESYTWMFEGGQPALSSLENPTVTYNVGGVFDVTLIVTNSAGSDTIIQTGAVTVQAIPVVDFSFVSTGLTVNFTNLLQNFNGTLLWDFGDNMTSNLPNPTHTYASGGIYQVTLTATNDCGVITQTQSVSTGSMPIAAFSGAFNSDCVPLTAFFTDQSGGADITEWFWEFPGGTPATSTEQNPEVTYTIPGIYNVTLTVTNDLGSNTITLPDYVIANDFPDASFEYEITDNVVTFTNTSDGGNTYTWDFGDGSPTTNELNPTHTYTSNGLFSVTLVASNLSCANVDAQEIFIDFTATEEVFENELISVFPNPVGDVLRVELLEDFGEEVFLRLFDVQGRVWREKVVLNGGNVEIDVLELASGVYILEVTGIERRLVRRILKE